MLISLDSYKQEFFGPGHVGENLWPLLSGGISEKSIGDFVSAADGLCRGTGAITENIRSNAESGLDSTGSSNNINVFPFNTPWLTNLGKLLAVCGAAASQAGARRFRKCLSYIVEYGEQSVRFNETTEIVLLTDRWLPEVFAEYEHKLLLLIQKAITSGHRYKIVFILYTDYGITRIPFVFDEKQQRGLQRVELNPEKDCTALLEQIGVARIISSPYPGLTSNDTPVRVKTNFEVLHGRRRFQCEVETEKQDLTVERKTYFVSRQRALRFARETSFLLDNPPVEKDLPHLLDAGSTVIEMYGKTWDLRSLGAAAGCVVEAFDHLIEGLKPRTLTKKLSAQEYLMGSDEE